MLASTNDLTFDLEEVVVCKVYIVFPDPCSPFGSTCGWRNNIQFSRNVTLQLGDKSNDTLGSLSPTGVKEQREGGELSLIHQTSGSSVLLKTP